jgi:hypothetical protein
VGCDFTLSITGWKMLQVESISNTAEGLWYTDFIVITRHCTGMRLRFTGSPFFYSLGLSWKDFEETRNWCVCSGAEAASGQWQLHILVRRSKNKLYSWLTWLELVSFIYRKLCYQISPLYLTVLWSNIICLVQVNCTLISGQLSCMSL